MKPTKITFFRDGKKIGVLKMATLALRTNDAALMHSFKLARTHGVWMRDGGYEDGKLLEYAWYEKLTLENSGLAFVWVHQELSSIGIDSKW